VEELKAEFDKALMKAETGIGPRKLYGDESLLDRIIRDNFKDLRLVYTDSKRIQDHLKQEYGLPALLHQDEQNIFDFYGVEKELLKLRHDRVSLPGGGNIVIERTEAMYVVDVNSAKRSGPKANEESVLEINMQAARETARQIRLRNMAGIILIDFIDMEDPEHNEALLHYMEKEMAKDSLKNTVYPVTELGLMQVARRSKG
jgi:ribonuclease G